MGPRDYGPFPYTPINDRPKLKWPNGARLAVWIIPNIEFFPLTLGIAGSPYTSHAPVPSVRAWAQRDYGNRVGIWRIMDVLSKRGIRASPTLNMDICGERLVSIPYSYEINESPFIQTRNGTVDQFVAAIKRQFDTLYAEGAQSGRVMAICLHPYLIGVPHRIQGLAEAVDYIAAHDGVWFATGEEIVRAWLDSGATF